jgi:transposase-like protein
MTAPSPIHKLKEASDALKKHGSQGAAAAALGMSRATLQSRLREWNRRKDEPLSAAPALEESSSYNVRLERKLTAAQDENNRLKKALRDAHREANTEDILRDVIGKIATAPAGEPAWATERPERKRGKPTPEAACLMLADWHGGEVVEPAEVNGFNAYDMAIAEERAERAIETGIKLSRKHMENSGDYAGAIVPLVGDFVSGGLHAELKATDEEEAISATIILRGWLRTAIRRVADEFGRVYVPAVAGNHGRNTAKPEFKRYYKKNFDWLIYKLLEGDFQDDPRVTVDVRPSNDVFFRVFNMRYLLQHGDMLGVKGGDGIIGSIGPIMRGEVKKSGQSSALGFGFDKLLIGHWHQRLWLPRATVGNTLKGFDEYAKNQLGAKPDRPSQSLFFIHPAQGETSHWDVYVDDKPTPSREWVSVMGAQ